MLPTPISTGNKTEERKTYQPPYESLLIIYYIPYLRPSQPFPGREKLLSQTLSIPEIIDSESPPRWKGI
jgi:hypothetical protein